MFDDTFKTITLVSEGVYREKGSKFIAIASPVENEAMVKERLAEIQKKYFDARHHCYAYILGPDKSAYRINDNGEPSGTAGRPIYGQLLSKDVTNALVVVVRYFGGIKLGVSGLINAYKTAAKEALEANTIVVKTIDEHYRCSFNYPEMNRIMQILKDEYITITKQSYNEKYNIDFKVRRREADRFLHALQKVPDTTITIID